MRGWNIGGINIDECRVSKGRFPANLLVSDDVLDLAVPKSFCSDTSSLGQAIRKIRGGSSLLKAIGEAIRVQSGVLARMRELATQSASGITDNVERKAIASHFLGLQKELSGTQNFLIKSQEKDLIFPTQPTRDSGSV